MIYFDNAATTAHIGTPQAFYNPSSPHVLGIKAERALRDARAKIAASLVAQCHSSFSVSPEEIIFTSGGTESNNLAILGFVLTNMRQGSSLIASPYEHPSILAPVEFACKNHWAGAGNIKAIPAGNILVSLSHVNHETGDINDIGKIAKSIKEKNPGAVIHVDGVQGFCKTKIDLGLADMYTFSGHKCHGPAGVGGLWVRKGVRLLPLIHGGGQERGLRAGTENVSGIVEMASVTEALTHQMKANHDHVASIKAVFLDLQHAMPDVMVNSMACKEPENSKESEASPYILNMSFLGVKGEILVHALSEKGVCVSMGAACRSRKNSPSALELMGFSSEIAQSAIRFSFSYLNTLEEAEYVRDLVINEVRRFRKMKGMNHGK